MEKLANEIAALKERYEKMPAAKEAKAVSREEFTLLLSGISACRKVPGIPVHMGYETLYHCGSEEESAQVREHMMRMFGVEDKETLLQACYQGYSGSREYEQFMTFWNHVPLFDVSELNAEGRERFLHCKQLAEHFYPIVKEKGFYAWDINERIGLCRSAVACGTISEEEFWEITDAWVREAQVFYHSYGEYAVSCLCGALYHMGKYEPDVSGFLEINRNLTDHLLEEGGAWQRNQWYVPQKREGAVLLDNRLGNMGCFITRKALDEGRIGYMYRDEPCPDQPDSGWRFFVGDESDEYINNLDNTVICTLNTICNISPDTLVFLHAPVKVGQKFGKHENGWEEE